MKDNSCMINEENFERLTTSLDKNAKEHLSYERLVSLWNDYCDVASLSPDEISAEKSDFVTIAHYYSIAWGLCCLSISSNSSNEKADSFAYTIQSMTAAIANNTQSIMLLLHRGLHYQASILARNQYELCFSLLNILIDPIKRNAFLSSCKNNNATNVWRKYFSIKQLNSTLSAFESNLAQSGELGFLGQWRREGYVHHSSAVHNSYLALIASHFVPKESFEDNQLSLSLWGTYRSFIEKDRAHKLDDLLLYTDKVFHWVFSPDHGHINIRDYCAADGFDNWNLSLSLFLFIEAYFLETKMTEESMSTDQNTLR